MVRREFQPPLLRPRSTAAFHEPDLAVVHAASLPFFHIGAMVDPHKTAAVATTRTVASMGGAGASGNDGLRMLRATDLDIAAP